MSDALALLVFESKKVLGHPVEPGEARTPARGFVLEIGQAFRTKWPTDAHFVAYRAEGPPYRLRKAAAADPAIRPLMTLLVLDVDDPDGHRLQASAEAKWRSAENEKVQRLLEAHPGAFVYQTRGGYRIVWKLPRPVAVAETDWPTFYVRACCYVARAFGIVPDPACSDWTRFFRMPHARRDGVLQELPTTGDPGNLGSFDWQPSPDGLEADHVTAAELATGSSSPGWRRVAEALSPARPYNPPPSSGPTTPYGRAALVAIAGEMAAAPEGSRNQKLNACAYRVGRLVGGGEIDEGDALGSLRAAGAACGLAPGEVEKTIRSGLTSGMKKPRSAAPRKNTRGGTARVVPSSTASAPESPAEGPAQGGDSQKVEQLETALAEGATNEELVSIVANVDSALLRDQLLTRLAKERGIGKPALKKEVRRLQEEDDDEGGRGPSVAEVLVRIGLGSSYLFHDETETEYAAVGDPRRILQISSSAYTSELSRRYYQQTEKVANGEAVAAARAVLKGKARFDGPRHELFNRFAFHDGAVWIDMADDKQRAARVTAEGWSIEKPPILFRRFRAQAPLPEPATSGDLSKLERFLNLREASDHLLVKAWQVCSVLGHIPRPGLAFHGPQGAAKTTSAKILRRLNDPSSAGTNRLSDRDEELALTLQTNAVPLFDNLVRVPARAGELLCQAVTGGGFSKRELYSDSDEVVYSFRRALLLTGITIPTVAPDLLDRLLLVQLERVPREARLTESAFWTDFEEAAPGLFAGILDALSGAMKVHEETIRVVSTLERMADFTRWGASVSQALGFGRDAFLSAYSANVGRQTEEVLDADPVARAVRELLATGMGEWRGTASDLFNEFKRRHPDDYKTDGWPKRSDGLSRRLAVLETTLADVGIAVVRTREGQGRDRFIALRKTSPPVRVAGMASVASVASGGPVYAGPDADAKADAISEVGVRGVRHTHGRPAPDAKDAFPGAITGDEGHGEAIERGRRVVNL